MQARIRKTELDAFRAQASNLKAPSIIPILAFVKIEVKGDDCSLTKNNNKAFVIRTFQNDSDDCILLVDETTLYNFLNFSDAEYINFELTGNRVKIYDERSFVESPTERAIMYSSLDTSNKEWTSLPKLALAAAGICSNLIFNGEIADPKSNVFIGQGHVAGTDGMVGYIQKIDSGLPDIEIPLRKEIALSISKMNECQYSSNSSYDLFKDQNTLYGFSKGETKFFNLVPLFQKIETDLSFSIPKNILVKFCSLCISSIQSKAKLPSATMKMDAGKLILNMEDSEIKIESFIALNGNMDPFKFNPESMKTLLESLPCEIAYFHPGVKRYYITDLDKTFLSVIMQII